jgi:hypothetical protein
VVVPATVTAQVGVPMSYKVNALNLPSAFASTGLPAGLSLNATSGFISGTPSVAGNASVNVTASNSGGNGTGTIGINVAKGNQAIYGVATNTTRTVNATYSLNATSSANLTLSYSSLNPNVATVAANGTVSVIGAGTATLTVNQSGNANYNPAPSVFQVLTAIANSPTINLIPPSNLTYDSLPKNFTATANGVSEFNYVYTGRNATSYKASALAPALAGEYTVNVKSPATSTMAAGAASANFTITRKPLTVSFGNLTKSYDGTTGISYVSTLVGKVGTDDVTLGGNRTLAFANAMVGTNKPINATGVNLLLGSKAPNYQLNSTSNLTGSITPKTVTLKANDVSKVFGSNLTTSNGSTAFTVIGLVSPDVIGSVTITYGNGNASAAAPGVYAGQVTPSAAVFTSGNSTNYSLTYVSGNLNVSAPPPTLNRALGGSASSTFTVRWSAVAGATGYNVERSLSANMSNSTIATTGNATSFTLNATGNSLNFVRVRGVGSAGNGTWSDIQAVQHIMIPANGTMYVAPAVNPGTGNYTVNGVFGSVNEAGLTPSSSPNTATQILQLANGTATAPIYFSTNGNWTKNATAAGSTSLPAGSAFALKNTQSSVRYIALSGRIYSNATTSNVTLSGQNKSTLIGTLRSRPSTLNDLNLRPGLTNGLFSASSQASADQVLFNEPSGALSIYWYNSSANRWYLNSVPAIPNPIVPAGAGILIRRATSSLFNTWTPPVD